ncbi:MAG TPA: ZIP family metal transporter [Candidatus Paceibacterota bacterium]|nr:ZIP family metal transporter [Candidatus Paceibacterota bacterium]
MTIWLYSLGSVAVVSIISLLGAFLFSLRYEKIRKFIIYFVSLAAGALLGDVFIHLIPESFEKSDSTALISLSIIGGMLLFFILEKYIRWRHCHLPETEVHIHSVVSMNVVGDGVHNIIDGMVIAATYLVSIPVGVATTIAVLLHEIPQEIGDFAVLLHGGLSIKKALIFNFLTAILSFLGAIISLVLGPYVQGYAQSLLPIMAGGFLYIAGSDLIPELHNHENKSSSVSVAQLIFMILGILSMLAVGVVG